MRLDKRLTRTLDSLSVLSNRPPKEILKEALNYFSFKMHQTLEPFTGDSFEPDWEPFDFKDDLAGRQFVAKGGRWKGAVTYQEKSGLRICDHWTSYNDFFRDYYEIINRELFPAGKRKIPER